MGQIKAKQAKPANSRASPSHRHCQYGEEAGTREGTWTGYRGAETVRGGREAREAVLKLQSEQSHWGALLEKQVPVLRSQKSNSADLGHEDSHF